VTFDQTVGLALRFSLSLRSHVEVQPDHMDALKQTTLVLDLENHARVM